MKIWIETNENENMIIQNLSDSESSAKGNIHKNTSFSQETSETLNKWPNSTAKAMRRRRNEEPWG